MATRQQENADKENSERKDDAAEKDDDPINISTADDVDIDDDNSVSDIGTNEPPPVAPKHNKGSAN